MYGMDLLSCRRYYHLSNALQYSIVPQERPSRVMYDSGTFFYGVPPLVLATGIS